MRKGIISKVDFLQDSNDILLLILIVSYYLSIRTLSNYDVAIQKIPKRISDVVNYFYSYTLFQFVDFSC